MEKDLILTIIFLSISGIVIWNGEKGNFDTGSTLDRMMIFLTGVTLTLTVVFLISFVKEMKY